MPTSNLQLGPSARRILRIAADGSPEIVIDHWRRLADDEPIPTAGSNHDPAVPILVSIARRDRDREALRGRPGSFGVWLRGDAEAEQVSEAIAGLPLVAIEVAKFTDGRHYSLARLLRDRFGFAGELRAFGDVQPDQLLYMRRCGYSSFELKPGKSLETGLRTLTAFTVSYQAGADAPPLFRRR